MARAYLLLGLAQLVRRAGRAVHDWGWSARVGVAERENRITQFGQTLISVAYAIERQADRAHDRSYHR